MFIFSVKKEMFKMFTVGEMATILLMQMQETATLQRCPKQTLHQCARHLLLALIYSSNAMKCVKVGKVTSWNMLI